MNIQLALFKLLITLYNVVRLTLVFIPLIYAILLIRTPSVIEIPLLKVLFLSFAPALGTAVWNALRFEQFHHLATTYYQKSAQMVEINYPADGETIRKAVGEYVNQRKWRWLSESDHHIELKSSPARDRIHIEWTNELIKVESKPAFPWIFIDFGRNYKNILQLLIVIKKAHSKSTSNEG